MPILALVASAVFTVALGYAAYRIEREPNLGRHTLTTKTVVAVVMILVAAGWVWYAFTDGG